MEVQKITGEMNQRYSAYEAERKRLQQLLRDGLISSDHYIDQLHVVKEEYSDVVEKMSVERILSAQ